MAMEKLFDKIGDHFNNTEMADRILVVKVRTDGWEQLEAAVRVRTSSAKLKLDSNGDDSEVGSEEDTKTPEKCNKKDAESPTDKKTDSWSESNVSADSGIALEEPKHETTSKRKIKKDADEVDASQGSDATATLWARGTEVSSVEDEAPEQHAVATDSTEPEAHKCANGDSTQRNCLSPGELGAEEKKCTESHGVSECCLQSTVVSEYEIHVHSFWLALNSSYFRSLLFSSGMKETRCKKVEMNISQSLAAMFLKLIESLYKPEVVVGENVDNLLILMRLAHLYDCDSTLKTCQSLLGSAHLTVEICDRSLNMPAHEMLPEMEEFIKRCEEFLVAEFSPLDEHWAREDFLALSPSALKKVLGSSDLCISSENTVFLALMRWALVNEVFEDHLKPLLDLVHMNSMTINYLHDVVTSDHPIASTVPGFHGLFEEAVFFHAFSTERRRDEGEPQSRKISKEPTIFRWTVDLGEDLELEKKKKKIVKSPHFWVSGYEMFLELKLRVSGFQGLYLTICTQEFRHPGKGFVKLEYSLKSSCQKATQVIKEADVFDREGSGWGYEEFFPMTWLEFRTEAHKDGTPLVITAQVRLME